MAKSDLAMIPRNHKAILTFHKYLFRNGIVKTLKNKSHVSAENRIKKKRTGKRIPSLSKWMNKVIRFM